MWQPKIFFVASCLAAVLSLVRAAPAPPTYAGFDEVRHHFFKDWTSSFNLHNQTASECGDLCKDDCVAFMFCDDGASQGAPDNCFQWKGTFSPKGYEWGNCTLFYKPRKPTDQELRQYRAEVEYKLDQQVEVRNVSEPFQNVVQVAAFHVDFDGGSADATDGRLFATGQANFGGPKLLPGSILIEQKNQQLILTRDSCKVIDFAGTIAPDNLKTVEEVQFLIDGLLFTDLYRNSTTQGSLTFMGTETIRGMQASVWMTNISYSGGLPLQFGQRWFYFSKPEFYGDTGNSVGEFEVPLRVVTDGLRQRLADGQWVPFFQSLDLVGFQRVFKFLPIDFQTPPGFVCYGRKTTARMPAPPSQFSTRTNSIISTFSATDFSVLQLEENSQTLYDYNSSYTAIYMSVPVGNISQLSNKVLIQHDFSSGFAYLTDQVSGRCVVKNITDDTTVIVDHDPQGNMAPPGAFTMMDPDLYNYTYSGLRAHHDVLSHVFSAYVDDYKTLDVNNVTYVTVLLEVYFAAADVPGRLVFLDEPAWPRATEVTYLKGTDRVTEHSEFYDARVGPPDARHFDTTDCFSSYDLMDLIVKMQGDFSAAKQNPNSFLTAFRAQIKELAGVSPFRLQRFQVHQAQPTNGVYVTLTLREGWPAGLAPASTQPPPRPTSNQDVLSKVRDAVAAGTFNIQVGGERFRAADIQQVQYEDQATTPTLPPTTPSAAPTSAGCDDTFYPLSMGGLVGLSIGLFAFGIVAAVGAIFLYAKVFGRGMPGLLNMENIG